LERAGDFKLKELDECVGEYAYHSPWPDSAHSTLADRFRSVRTGTGVLQEMLIACTLRRASNAPTASSIFARNKGVRYARTPQRAFGTIPVKSCQYRDFVVREGLARAVARREARRLALWRG
jgi:hypothetical protein